MKAVDQGGELASEIQGLKLFRLQVYRDSRGFFTESWRQDELAGLGLPGKFVQDNHSSSAPRVLRGLHIQRDPMQGKLVRAMRGRIWDVAVDLRPGSSTFGKSHGLELSDRNDLVFWIPPGFAHGFCVLGDEPADVVYKVDAYYSAATDGGLLWNDPDLGIRWPIENPVLSEKDTRLPRLKDSGFRP